MFKIFLKKHNIPKAELEVFKLLKDVKIVFDVGARTDTDYYNLRPDIEYHLFEPNPAFYSKIKSRPNIIINRFGLSDVKETKTYYDFEQSFIHRFDGEKGPSFPLIPLDYYYTTPDFLKIDAEGYDYKILLGATETLKKVKYVQFEFWKDGVQKFVDLLTDFELYLIVDEALRKVIQRFTREDKYDELLVPLTPDAIDLIEYKIIPLDAGGNILGIRKQSKI